jgi:hypothetical protein
MTAPSPRPTQCPNCKHDNEVETYETITSHDRQLRERLVSGALWTWRCANCAKDTVSLYPVLYHDMRAWCMIYYLDRRMTDDPRIIERMVPAADQLTALRRFNANYRFRLCRSLDDFIEKIRILEAGLDDRAVEYLKCLDRWAAFNPRFERAVDGESKSLEFTMTTRPQAPGRGERSIELPYSAYADVLAKINERIGRAPDISSGFIIVDRSYVEERFPETVPKPPETSAPRTEPEPMQPSGSMGSVVFGRAKYADDARKPWWRFW